MITPEQFMTLTEPDEPDETEPPWGTYANERAVPDPLTSIAASLRTIATSMQEQVPGSVVLEATDGDAEQQLREELADLEDKHRSLYVLLADVEKIVKPSTSKLANSVREAITRWRNPEVVVETVEDEPDEPVPTANAAEMGLPANDAPLEDWLTYAEGLGHEVPGHMNRSQIRTMLGIAQPVEVGGQA